VTDHMKSENYSFTCPVCEENIIHKKCKEKRNHFSHIVNIHNKEDFLKKHSKESFQHLKAKHIVLTNLHSMEFTCPVCPECPKPSSVYSNQEAHWKAVRFDSSHHAKEEKQVNGSLTEKYDIVVYNGPTAVAVIEIVYTHRRYNWPQARVHLGESVLPLQVDATKVIEQFDPNCFFHEFKLISTVALQHDRCGVCEQRKQREEQQKKEQEERMRVWENERKEREKEWKADRFRVKRWISKWKRWVHTTREQRLREQWKEKQKQYEEREKELKMDKWVSFWKAKSKPTNDTPTTSTAHAHEEWRYQYKRNGSLNFTSEDSDDQDIVVDGKVIGNCCSSFNPVINGTYTHHITHNTYTHN